MSVTMKLDGDKALEKALRSLPDRVFNRVVKRAASLSMTPVSRQAKANARAIKETGTLAASIGKKTKAYRRHGVVVVLIGPRTHYSRDTIHGKRMPRFYAHLVEKGTRPHRVGKGSQLTRTDRRTTGVQTGAMHPGAKAQPFIVPALESQRAAVVARYRAELRNGIEREAKKVGR